MTPSTLSRARAAAPLILAAIAILSTVFYLPDHPFVDEYIHWPTAQLFAQGHWLLNPAVSTWPTMNAVVGWTVALLHQRDNLVAGRLVIAAFALLAVIGFHRLAQQFDEESAGLRTAQFFLSPVVLPFCALVYTDLPALSCLLWATVGALRRQAWLMLSAGLLACAFRQNDIVWFAALAALFGWIKWRNHERIAPLHVAAAIAVGIAWLGIVVLQHGVTSGAYTQHDHPGGLNGIPNIWFALAVAAMVYLPYFLFRVFESRERLALWQFLALGALVALTFHVSHRLNMIEPHYFLRNGLLRWTATRQGMGVFLAAVSLTAVMVYRTRFARHDELRLPFLLFSTLSLLPFWLIEQRYYLPIFALFWTMRSAVDRRVENAQLIFGAACSVWVIACIAQGRTFL